MPVTTLPTRFAGLSRRGFVLTLAGAAALRAQDASDHWALLSDTHIPADPANGHRGFRPGDNLAKVVPQVVAAKPEAALVCGDVARLTGEPGDYQAFESLMKPVMDIAPVSMALGNHDHRKNFLDALGKSQKNTQTVPQKHVIVIEGRAVRVVVLDSLIQPNLTPGLLGKNQRAWLEKYLGDVRPMPTLLCVHHTLDDNDGSLLDAPRLFEIVRPHRHVKAIVFGHSHRYSFEQTDGIHLINLPAVGYNFNDNQPVGWVDARFTSKGGSFTLRAVGGDASGDGKTTELNWRA